MIIRNLLGSFDSKLFVVKGPLYVVVIGPWMNFNDDVLDDSGLWSLKLHTLTGISYRTIDYVIVNYIGLHLLFHHIQ